MKIIIVGWAFKNLWALFDCYQKESDIFFSFENSLDHEGLIVFFWELEVSLGQQTYTSVTIALNKKQSESQSK